MITMAEVVQRATSVTFDRAIVVNVFRSVLVEAIVAAALPGKWWGLVSNPTPRRLLQALAD